MKYKFLALIIGAALLGTLLLRFTQGLPKPDVISAQLVSQIAAAKADLPQFRDRLTHPRATDRSFFLRVKFTDKKNTEFIWMNQVEIEGNDFRAKVAQAPFVIAGIHLGQVVPVKEADVVDWTIKHNDGTLEGNYTQGLEPNRH